MILPTFEIIWLTFRLHAGQQQQHQGSASGKSVDRADQIRLESKERPSAAPRFVGKVVGWRNYSGDDLMIQAVWIAAERIVLLAD